MGYAELHTEEQQSKKFDQKFLAHLLKDVKINSIQQEKTKLWTEEANKEHILEHANINVPTQFKAKYQNLLQKHFGTVSINK
jgi:hypothetical protein